MQIWENVSLKQYNTFGIEALSKYFAVVKNSEEIKEALAIAANKNIEDMVLGGGSNVLLTKNFEGVVIKNDLKGIEVVDEDKGHVYVRVAAGEVWHQFVLFCLKNNWAGIENLALIPGCTGASPMQNIGAYGVEIKSVFHSLSAIHKKDFNVVVFNNADCEFGYRESVFKNKYRNQFIITDVTYKLSKTPVYHIEYGAIKQELERMNVTALSIQEIAQAVINIRSSKLPNPKVIGNAGSFFKNPSVSQAVFEALKIKFPNLIGYINANGSYKIAAGWMIEQCGLKGFRKGDAGVHDKQALVLVNYGNASGADILGVCDIVKKEVYDKFGILLTPEVNII